MLADERLPGFRRLPPKQRAVYATVAAVVVVVGVLLAYYTNLLLDRSTAADRARSDKQAEQAVDREQPAFVSTVTPLDDQYLPDAVAVLLDRPLTEDEQATLTAMRGEAPQVWAFLEPLGGRIVEHASYVAPFEDGNERRGDAQTFDLNLNSDRAAGLTINSMTAVKDSCRPPTAQTVVNIPPAGAESRQGLLWDLTGGPTDRPRGPYVLDEGESQGQLYFRRNVVELGNGQSNMAFRIQPEVSTHTCDWHIVASYTDTTGSHEQRIPSGTDTFTTEAIPRQPVQYFERIPGTGWACLGEVDQQRCPATGSLIRNPPQGD
ncbi:hypothetical protein GA0074692_2372 [Micromonospora pallida]|uniref:Uncharacterized protein n=1 Tax=Micromonospora pallida TaxID=145854 RepID=A0A1C6SDK2_9ACTN|nr:hypothetical protein [Micromonospora pallida]SCL27562.1 hypothetical protein GA0074692_2372 [Micromonospora pallida]